MNHRIFQMLAFAGAIVVPGILFAQPPGRGGPPGGQQGGMWGGPPMQMIMQIFNQADANNDGSVTLEELTAAMQNQTRGGRLGRGGPPQGDGQNQRRGPGGPPHQNMDGEQDRGHEGHGGPQGPPPQPGQVLPEQVAGALNLNEKQTRQLAALQADVDKRLAAILTDEQQQQMRNARPPHGPGHAEGNLGGRPADRPDRPQRPE